MRKVVHRQDVGTLRDLPIEVASKAKEIAGILDDNYGEDRHEIFDLGGYILIAENTDDVESMRKIVDFDYVLPEYVEMISCSHVKEYYTNSLMLLSSDYSISLLIPLKLTPKELLQYMDVEGREAAWAK